MTTEPSALTGMERDRWDRAVGDYEALLGRATRQFVDSLLDLAAVGAGTAVLDAGSGPGDLAIAAAGRGATVVAADLSARMLERVRERAPEIATLHVDGTGLPLDDGAVDAVVAGFLLNHVDDARATLAELRRVLRPGGRLAATIWDVPERARHNGLIFEAVAATLGGLPVTPRPSRPLVASEDALRELLEGAGFVETSADRVDGTLAVADPAELLDLVARSTALSAELVAAVPGELRPRLDGELARRMKPYRDGPAFILPTPALLFGGRVPQS